MRLLWRPCQLFYQGILWLFQGFVNLIRQLFSRDRLPALICLLIWVVILLSNFVWRGTYIFEGNLIVAALNFTYTGSQASTFLNPINDLRQLDLRGQQETLTFTGKFSLLDPTANPRLDRQLSQLSQLTLKLPSANSILRIAPANPTQPSELSLLNLSIQPQSHIHQLSYSPNPAQLSFCLRAAAAAPATCRFPDDSPASVPIPLGTLTLQLGDQPLILTASRYTLPQLELPADRSDATPLSLRFTPDNGYTDFLLPLASPTQLQITPPNLRQSAPSTSSSTSSSSPQSQSLKWFRSEIAVQDVDFVRSEVGEKVTDILESSTILAGEARLQDKVIKLQENQFLVILPDTPNKFPAKLNPFQSQPTIKTLHSLQIHTQSPQGIRTLFSGRAEGIAVGFDRRFPVQSIAPSLLSQHLSQEGVNALLAFIATLTALFLPRLFSNPAHTKSR